MRPDPIATPILEAFDRRMAALDTAQPFAVRIADSDGYRPGQQDRAVVLDFFGRWAALGEAREAELDQHPACDIDGAEGDVICDGLIAEGLLDPDWIERDPRHMLTAAGRDAAAVVTRALAEIDAAIAAPPPAATNHATLRGVTVL